jgi:16S rRNA (cytosine1402-N4)-methyltransferase
MIAEVLEVLAPRTGAIYVDGTFGAGGYARALMDAADCRVFGIDRDPGARARASALAGRYRNRLFFLPGRFGEMDRLLGERGVRQVDGVTLDLGVSSMQIDEAARGFSFRHDGPLDMRMSGEGPSAADVVNGASEADLADIIHMLGEERRARRIARAIVEMRAGAPITRTLQLADIVRRCQPAPRPGTDTIDPATRTFQALRMHVNDELGELARGLVAAEALLAPGGRLAVVSFHSLEDRAVKTFLRARSGRTPRGSRHLPDPAGEAPAPSFTLLSRRAVRPSAREVAANPRARSARLRAAERTAAAPWPRHAASAAGGAAP